MDLPFERLKSILVLLRTSGPSLKIKGFDLDELRDDSGNKLREMSARSMNQSPKKGTFVTATVKTSVKSLFKSMKGIFN